MGHLQEVEADPRRQPSSVFEQVFGFVPKLFREQSILPAVVEAQAGLLQALELDGGTLSRVQKERIQFAVAAARGNPYCAGLRYQMLCLLGVAAEDLENIAAGQQEAGLSPADAALIRFAVRLAVQSTSITGEDVVELRTLGWADEAVLDAILTTAWANCLCIISTGIGAEPDFTPPQLSPAAAGPWPDASEDSAAPYLRTGASEDSVTFAFFRENFGFIPSIYKSQGARPDVLAAEAHALAALLINDGALKRLQKERILLAVSARNQNTYFVTLHAEMLGLLGVPPEESYQVAEDHARSVVTESEHALLDCALKLAIQPPAFSRDDVELLHRQGFNDEQVLEAVAATAFTIFLNTLQMGLGASPDFAPRRSFRRSCEKDPNLLPSEPRPTSEEQPADPDGELVARAQAGDLDAFESLVHRHGKRIYRTLVGILGDQEDARDAMQESFLKAFQHLGGFERRSKFSTWLVSIASNTGLERLRQRRPMESLDTDSSASEVEFRPRQVRAWTEDPEQLYSQTEMRALVERSVKALPAKYRVVVLLRDFEQLPAEEAAAALGLSIPALKSRLLRGRLMLREALAPHFAAKGVGA